jgi:LPS-assembly lipoprotein
MKQFFALVAFALIAGCGFKPVYATGAGATYGGAITVEPIDGRSGYILRRALQEELAIGLPNVTEAASLQITVKENLTRLAFQQDGAAARSNVTLSGRYALSQGQERLIGHAVGEVSFAVPSSTYGDIAAQKSASERAAGILAKNIVDDLRRKLSVE